MRTGSPPETGICAIEKIEWPQAQIEPRTIGAYQKLYLAIMRELRVVESLGRRLWAGPVVDRAWRRWQSARSERRDPTPAQRVARVDLGLAAYRARLKARALTRLSDSRGRV